MCPQLRVYISSRLRKLWHWITGREEAAEVSAAAEAAANHLWMTGRAYRQFAEAAETTYPLHGFAAFFRQLAEQADAEAADMASLVVQTSPRPSQPAPSAQTQQAQPQSQHDSVLNWLRAGRELERENERQARLLYSKQTAAGDIGGAVANWRQTARLAGCALTRLQTLVRHLNAISAVGVSVDVYDRLTMQQELFMPVESKQDTEEKREAAAQGDSAVSIPV